MFSFKKQKNSSLENYSEVAVDFHNHLIPCIDDGSRSLSESINMLKGLSELGYKKIITTPHIHSDFYPNTPEKIEQGFEKLQEAVKQEDIELKLGYGAEYYLDYEFSKNLKYTKLLNFCENHILVELSSSNPPPNLADLFFSLQVKKMKVILAHPERYTYWHTKMEIYEEMHERGVLFQMNINSLNGYYSGMVMKFAEKLIKEDLVDFVCTDLHSIDQLEGIKKALTNQHLIKLIESGKLKNSSLL